MVRGHGAPYLDDYAAATAGQRPPRNVNIITGASGTTDIEGSLVLGAHGPRYLHVVVVEDLPCRLSAPRGIRAALAHPP